MTLRKEIEEQIRINVVYVSTKNGIDRKHCDEFPRALTPQICSLIKERLEKLPYQSFVGKFIMKEYVDNLIKELEPDHLPDEEGEE